MKASLAYEEQLASNHDWALKEASEFFGSGGSIQRTVRTLASRLAAEQIPYAIVGGMALFYHEYRRFTEDVDVLVRPDDLPRIHAVLVNHGYRPLFEGSRGIRDTETNVRIKFLLSGEFPGDGKPKPLAFPDPSDFVPDANGVRYVTLEKLIELKLASGISHPGRIRDLADVIELINILNLDDSYANRLAPYVREKFLELLRATQSHPDQPG